MESWYFEGIQLDWFGIDNVDLLDTINLHWFITSLFLLSYFWHACFISSLLYKYSSVFISVNPSLILTSPLRNSTRPIPLSTTPLFVRWTVRLRLKTESHHHPLRFEACSPSACSSRLPTSLPPFIIQTTIYNGQGG